MTTLTEEQRQSYDAAYREHFLHVSTNLLDITEAMFLAGIAQGWKAAQAALEPFARDYLLDEATDPACCIDEKHHAATVRLFEAFGIDLNRRGK